MEILKIICSLPTAIIIVGTFIFIAFMTHTGVFKNLKFKYKKKDQELQIETKERTQEEVEKKGEIEMAVSLPEKKKDVEEKEEIEGKIKEDKQELIARAFKAYEEQDLEGFTKYFDKVIKISDASFQPKLIAQELYLKYCLGDKNAIKQLKKLIDKKDESSKFARERLAFIYEDLEDVKEAMKLIEENIEESQDLEERLLYSLKLTDLKMEINEFQEGEKILEKLKEEFEEPSHRAKIFKKYGKLCEKKEKINLALNYYEKALEYNPTDDSLRFKVAYKYGEINQYEMQIFHYNILNKHNYSSKSVKNNLGVAYEELEMNINAVKLYHKSFKEEKALAAANLGYSYINAGFINEGRKILKKALEFEDVHENVNKALSEIEEKKLNEKNLEKKIINIAKIKREFSVKTCDSFDYTAKISESNIEGQWDSSLGAIKFTKEEKIKGEFKYEYENVIMNGELHNSIFDFKWEKGTYIKEKGDGILIFSENGNNFEGLLIGFPDMNEFIMFTGNRG